MIYYKTMKKSFITAERLMYFFVSIVLAIATFMNLTPKMEFRSVIPYTKYVEAVLNCSCSIICLILCIKPNWKHLSYIIFSVQATSTVLIGFSGIGTMLLMCLILSLFSDGFFKKNLKLKVSIISIWWFLVILGVIPPFGLRGGFFVLALTLFYLAIMITTYGKLRDKLSYLLPEKNVTITDLKLPPRGSKINLSDYGLTDRQIKFLKLCLTEGLTYEEIAGKNNISVSVVKKEMAKCCQVFGVKNREALRLLLLQYRFTFL